MIVHHVHAFTSTLLEVKLSFRALVHEVQVNINICMCGVLCLLAQKGNDDDNDKSDDDDDDDDIDDDVYM